MSHSKSTTALKRHIGRMRGTYSEEYLLFRYNFLNRRLITLKGAARDRNNVSKDVNKSLMDIRKAARQAIWKIDQFSKQKGAN